MKTKQEDQTQTKHVKENERAPLREKEFGSGAAASCAVFCFVLGSR